MSSSLPRKQRLLFLEHWDRILGAACARGVMPTDITVDLYHPRDYATEYNADELANMQVVLEDVICQSPSATASAMLKSIRHQRSHLRKLELLDGGGPDTVVLPCCASADEWETMVFQHQHLDIPPSQMKYLAETLPQQINSYPLLFGELTGASKHAIFEVCHGALHGIRFSQFPIELFYSDCYGNGRIDENVYLRLFLQANSALHPDEIANAADLAAWQRREAKLSEVILWSRERGWHPVGKGIGIPENRVKAPTVNISTETRDGYAISSEGRVYAVPWKCTSESEPPSCFQTDAYSPDGKACALCPHEIDCAQEPPGKVHHEDYPQDELATSLDENPQPNLFVEALRLGARFEVAGEASEILLRLIERVLKVPLPSGERSRALLKIGAAFALYQLAQSDGLPRGDRVARVCLQVAADAAGRLIHPQMEQLSQLVDILTTEA